MVRIQLRQQIAIAITGARERAGLSQGDLARKVKTSRQTINAYEAAMFLPRLEILLRLARVLDLDLNALIDYGERL